MKKTIFVLLLLLSSKNVYSSLIADQMIYSTVRIQNEWDEFGTGFLVVPIHNGMAKIALITNKHVINENSEKRKSARYLTVYFFSRILDAIIPCLTTGKLLSVCT